MNDIQLKKNEIVKAYNNSPMWTAKVNKMSANQVIAVYRRLQRAGKINV